MKYEDAIAKIKSEGCAKVPHAHKLMCIGAMPKPLQNWLMDHTFVFMWVPLCVLIELIVMPIYIPVIFLTFWLSWDRQYAKNCSMVTNWFIRTSSLLPVFIATDRNICPYCTPLNTLTDLKEKAGQIKSMVLYSQEGIDYVGTRSGKYLTESVYKITPELKQSLVQDSKCKGEVDPVWIERMIARPKEKKTK
jgi:hypothetical protein